LSSLEDPYLEDFYILPVTRPGKANAGKQAYTDLKALTAWRMQKDGMSIFEALDFASRWALDFYQGERAFGAAVSRAEKKFQRLEEHFYRYVEELERHRGETGKALINFL
jgi:hypothetical protein